MIAAIIEANQKEKAKQKAREEYNRALYELKKKPTDPRLRETALLRGRTYSNLSRDSKGVTVLDEVSIKNDLDAATAEATVTATKRTVRTPSASPSLEERLSKLSDLKSRGLISDDEYALRRKSIIDEI